MLRNVGGVIAGLVVAVAAMMVTSLLGGLLVPAPAVDASSPEAMRQTYSSMSDAARAMVLFSWLVGVFAGSLTAKAVVGRPWAAWTVAILFELYILVSVLMLPMPGWMQVAALALPLVAGFAANHLVRSRAAPADGNAEEGVEGDAQI